MTTLPLPAASGPVEYTPLSPLEVAELRAKIAAGHAQTAEECTRFLLSIRANLLAKPVAAASAKAGAKTHKPTPKFDVDFDI